MGRVVKSELVVYNDAMHIHTRFADTNENFMSAYVEVADGFLHIVEDHYDNSLMLSADAIPCLIKALQKLQRQAKKA
jgi:hypothetical protein